MAIILPAVRSWLTDPADPGGAMLRVGTRRTSGGTAARDGELRVFVGGVTQLVAYDTDTLDTPITLVGLDAVAVQQLRDWRGTLLLLRRIDGSRMYGGFLSIAENPLGNSQLTDCDVVFSRVTYSDALA